MKNVLTCVQLMVQLGLAIIVQANETPIISSSSSGSGTMSTQSSSFDIYPRSHPVEQEEQERMHTFLRKPKQESSSIPQQHHQQQHQSTIPNNNNSNNNNNNNRPKAPFTAKEKEIHRQEQTRRMKNRRESAKRKIQEMVENPHIYSNLNEHYHVDRLSPTDILQIHEEAIVDDPMLERSENQWLRQAWGGWSNKNNRKGQDAYTLFNLADPSEYYDEWAQAYRMLGEGHV